MNSTLPANSSYILKKIDFGVKCHSHRQSKGHTPPKIRIKLNPEDLRNYMIEESEGNKHGNLVQAKNEIVDFVRGTFQRYDVGSVPLVGPLLSVVKAIQTLDEDLLRIKLERFLTALNDVPDDERNQFAERLQNDEPFRRKVVRVMMDLPHLEEEQKVEWLANLTVAYALGHIDTSNFDSFRHVLRNSYGPDLELLKQFNVAAANDPEYKRDGDQDLLALHRLTGAGLLTGIPRVDGTSAYKVNDYGGCLVKFGMRPEIWWPSRSK